MGISCAEKNMLFWTHKSKCLHSFARWKLPTLENIHFVKALWQQAARPSRIKYNHSCCCFFSQWNFKKRKKKLKSKRVKFQNFSLHTSRLVSEWRRKKSIKHSVKRIDRELKSERRGRVYIYIVTHLNFQPTFKRPACNYPSGQQQSCTAWMERMNKEETTKYEAIPSKWWWTFGFFFEWNDEKGQAVAAGGFRIDSRGNQSSFERRNWRIYTFCYLQREWGGPRWERIEVLRAFEVQRWIEKDRSVTSIHL